MLSVCSLYPKAFSEGSGFEPNFTMRSINPKEWKCQLEGGASSFSHRGQQLPRFPMENHKKINTKEALEKLPVLSSLVLKNNTLLLCYLCSKFKQNYHSISITMSGKTYFQSLAPCVLLSTCFHPPLVLYRAWHCVLLTVGPQNCLCFQLNCHGVAKILISQVPCANPHSRNNWTWGQAERWLLT